MSEAVVNSDVAARLLGVAPKELSRLVSNGVVPRTGSNAFPLIGLVRSFVDHLRNETKRMQEKPTQAELARHLDMSERNLRDVLRALGLDHREATIEAIRIAYIRDLRDKAAGRGGNEQASLAKSRIRESEANAQLKELQFHKEVGTLVPVADIEQLLDAWATAGRSEIQNALEKFATAMMSQHNIEISQEQIDDAASSACRVIADYPQHFAGSNDQDGREVAAT